MLDIEIAILLALKEHGREKTFTDILKEGGIALNNNQKLELANKLEGAGLIQNVSYQLPFSVRAELTTKGLEYLHTHLSEK